MTRSIEYSFTGARRSAMKKDEMETPTVNPFPTPARREPTKLIQATVPMSLFKNFKKLSRSGDPKSPVTIQSVVEWGLREWVRKIEEKK